MPIKPIPVGLRFGKLIVLGRAENSHTGRARWNVRCDCGNQITADGVTLRNGHVSSCGCGRIEAITKHGLYKHPLYYTWKSMMRRCYEPATENYELYGGRGISVYKPWHDVATFIRDCEHLYKPNCLIDRIDNNAGYEPGNVRWATVGISNRNTRANVTLTLNGETKCISDWAKDIGIPRSTLYQRKYRGWSDKEILTTPVARH